MSKTDIEEDIVTIARKKRDELLKLSQGKVGPKRAMAGDDKRLYLETVPIDVPVLDAILGGGLRRGRMGMVIGEASMGKTLITQWVIAAFQRRGYVCGFIDPEKTYDEEWFRVSGVSTEDLIVVRPANTEQAFDLAGDWVENGMDLVVIDSLAALVPKARMEESLEGQEFMGLNPRKIGEGLAVLTNKNINSLILCTNQLRSKIGVVYGSPDEIPGGRAQKFYASYIVKVRRGGWLKDGDKKIGYHLKAETQKNKLAPPFQECDIPFLYSGVIDTVAGLVELAMELDVVPVKRGFYRWDDQTFHGQAKFKAYLVENPEAAERLKAAVEMSEAPEFEEVVVE